MPKRIVNAKIACLDFGLQKTKMKLGVQVVITDPEKLDQIRQRYVGAGFGVLERVVCKLKLECCVFDNGGGYIGTIC